MQTIMLILLLFPTLLAQISIILPQTLNNLTKNLNNTYPSEMQGLNQLLTIHPELANYTVTKINNTITIGNKTNTSNVKSFLFFLNKSNEKIDALVTLSDDPKQQFITLSPLVASSLNNQSNPNIGEYFFGTNTNQNCSAGYYTNVSTTSELNKNGSAPKINSTSYSKPPPGSFFQYTNYSDPLVVFVQDLVHAMHPNSLNYDVAIVQYQIVAGINVRVKYQGRDKLTNLTVLINFDIKLKPTLLNFSLDCQKVGTGCNDPETAQSIFNALQAIMISHPELIAYRLVDFAIETVSNPGNIKAMVTFENTNLQLRALIEVIINPCKATVLSFFTYSTAQ